MNILSLLTSSNILAKQFGLIDTHKLAKLAKSKFSEDIYETVKYSGKKLEKNIVKVKNLKDWQKYLTKVSQEKKLIRVEVTSAINPDYTLIYENFSKKKSLILDKLSNYKSVDDMYKNIIASNHSNLAADCINETNFENTRLYIIYNRLYSLINISSLVVFGLVFLSIFIQQSWANLWVSSLLRGILIYAAISLCTQILGFWLRKYPNLIWVNNNQEEFDHKLKEKSSIPNEASEAEENINSSNLLNSPLKYFSIFLPIALLSTLILYYIIFLP